MTQQHCTHPELRRCSNSDDEIWYCVTPNCEFFIKGLTLITSERVDDIVRRSYWKTDTVPPPPHGPTLFPTLVTTKHDQIFEHCSSCDTPNVCAQRGCGRLMRERLASYPECICATEPTKCLRHNSFVDNRPRKIGAPS